MHIKTINGYFFFRILDLSFNRITKIQNLENLTKLNKLYLCANKISKIENLSNLTALNMLELGDNKIRVILKIIKYCKNLFYIIFSNSFRKLKIWKLSLI